MIIRRAGVALLLVVAACGGTTAEPAIGDRAAGETHVAFVQAARAKLQTVPESVRWNIETWYNSTGLAQLDPDVWQLRLDRACAQEFWAKPLTLRRLGDEFVAADSVFPIKMPDIGPVEMQNAYDSLWVMALNHCRDIIPPEVIVGDPPDFRLDD